MDGLLEREEPNVNEQVEGQGPGYARGTRKRVKEERGPCAVILAAAE